MSPHDNGNRYQLTSRIATGGMGEVWRAEDTVLDREVAVKVLKHEFADDPVFRARFEAEARHAAALVHPNVASVFDFGELVDDDGTGTRPFLVMELVPGQPLSGLLRGGESMPADRASEIVAQAADAIAAAHALGIVHRDVKPANLLVTPDGQVKITDFGIARAGDGAAITQTGQIVGTPHYISPEQAEGRPASEASDIYALGVVLYECLAGQRPFARDTPIQVALAHIREDVPPLPDDVPARVRAIVEKALAKKPEDRFASAADLATALRGGAVEGLAAAGAAAGAAGMGLGAETTQILERPPTGPVAATPMDEDERDRKGLPPWWPWAAAAAAVLVVVLATAALAGSGSPEPAVANPEASSEASTEPSESPSERPSKKADDRIRVREADYLGRDAEEVKDELEARGFEVEDEKVPATSADQWKDTVAAVSPHGLVEPGSTITLEVYEEYKPEKSDEDWDEGDDDESGRWSDGHPGKGKGHKD
ncbi:MAG TPA: serine/threonine protein kinase [Nocardioidaceae bacterium]|nr:serine/threonine protein kinase [Nocardioidaceae bacterium]